MDRQVDRIEVGGEGQDFDAPGPEDAYSPGIHPGVRRNKGYYDPETGVPVHLGRATMNGYNQETPRLGKVRYSHEALIEMIIADPRISQKDLAAKFGFSTGWISRVMGSDAFQAALARRREEITDPFLIATVEERLKGLAAQSLDLIAEKLATVGTLDSALKVADMSVKALGFGARDRGTGTVNNQFVVQLPGKASSSADWAEAASNGVYDIAATKIVQQPSQNLSTTSTRDPLIQPEGMKIANQGTENDSTTS